MAGRWRGTGTGTREAFPRSLTSTAESLRLRRVDVLGTVTVMVVVDIRLVRRRETVVRGRFLRASRGMRTMRRMRRALDRRVTNKGLGECSVGCCGGGE